MLSSNFPIATGQSMGASFNSTIIPLAQVEFLSIQAIWTGSPVGNFTLQTSCDQGTDSQGDGVTNWTTYTGSSQAAGGVAGDLTYGVTVTGDRWIRLVYTRTSGTGTVNIRCETKGV